MLQLTCANPDTSTPDQEQRKDPPPPYQDNRTLPKKSTGPPGPARVQTLQSVQVAALRGQASQQRTILPKPNEQSAQVCCFYLRIYSVQ